MDRMKSIVAAAAVMGMLTATQAFAQTTATITDCGSSCRAGSVSFFGGHQNWREKWSISKNEWNAYKNHAELVRQRNEAWPKPFQCHDRRIYFATFYPMYQRGFEIQTTLTDTHFDKNTNKLNSAGKQKIAGIMQNLPLERRQIHIFETGDAEITQARMAEVRVALSDWFGHLAAPTIATTHKPAYYQNGVEVQHLNTNFIGSLPTPGVALGGSSEDSGGN